MNKHIQIMWSRYAKMLPETDEEQRRKQQQAFFAGAACLFARISTGLGPGSDADDDDMKLMHELDEEILAFGRQFDNEHLTTVLNTLLGGRTRGSA